MSPSKYHRQTPGTQSETTDADTKENGAGEIDAEDGAETAVGRESTTFEDIISEMIESETAELREELAALERDIEEVDNFARISLNERKVKQNEAKLSEFSESLTGFAERAFQHLNQLEERIDTQALLLAAILESLDDVDLTRVQRHRHERLVMDATPEERLLAAVDEASGSGSVEDIDGIGATYAERLADAGIGSRAALGAADPAAVADVAGVSTDRAREWIDQA